MEGFWAQKDTWDGLERSGGGCTMYTGVPRVLPYLTSHEVSSLADGYDV